MSRKRSTVRRKTRKHRRGSGRRDLGVEGGDRREGRRSIVRKSRRGYGPSGPRRSADVLYTTRLCHAQGVLVGTSRTPASEQVWNNQRLERPDIVGVENYGQGGDINWQDVQKRTVLIVGRQQPNTIKLSSPRRTSCSYREKWNIIDCITVG